MTFFAFGLGMYMLKFVLDNYIPAIDTRSNMLHVIVYALAFFTGF